MTFLVVDDSSTMRKIVTLALGGAGHSCLEAEHGTAALEKLKGARPDCIVLDINMPEMGGIDFLKARKSDPSLAGIPVIVLTTQDEAALREEAIGLGAKAFLVKPFVKDDLLATVRKVLG